ncbi:Na+ cotransporter [Bartonella henselae]|uniref:Na/Pi-cotransporter family protein n=1 Tax=Bartonella henselae TaxID=38323 RepID=X5M4A5_BARHN|nr:Na/Pi cotransporter family protein [Bartonella henselae]MDM9996546.1 Na/Pi cotransporter family protein [Bartonella henselae]OLL38491.1 Na+ cotransporter [Bartonella henselae]OLL47367.1 Na+ cotransporter [Bartonella henselae]OLL48987.1 Na+ cotransporter [Bartonella henselae]OLL49541.1 Na+ cotransporter [Bartonella henselae]
MNSSLVLLHLAGAISLLLWATRMVRTGVERAYGDRLKYKMRHVISKPFFAVSFGLLTAMILQSSTAITLLVGSFVESGFVSGLAGLMAVRGGELGSALVVKILSYDLTIIVPLCLLIGTCIFMTTEKRDWRQIGRIIIGIGLLILSLQMISAATEPLRDSAVLPSIISYLSTDPVSTFLLAAVLTYLLHSSIAGIILLVNFANYNLIHAQLCIIMVLGVNFGSSLIAPLLTRNASPNTRLVPLGNLLMRGAGSILVLILFLFFQPPITWLGNEVSTQVINAHIVFNVFILLAGIPLSKWVLQLTTKIVHLSTKKVQTDKILNLSDQTALDDSVLERPTLALSNVMREVIHICDLVDIMLEKIMGLYEKTDPDIIRELNQLNTILEKKHIAIKLYLARLAGQKLSDEEALQTQELLSTCIKLDQAGDIIIHNMLMLVKKKQQKGLQFSSDGWNDLLRFHAIVLANAHIAFNVLVSRDTHAAHLLVQKKDQLRNLEKEMNLKHFKRLREGELKNVESSSLHLDTVRDLKQINSLLTSMIYPILEAKGLLKSSRLRNPTE